VAPEILHDAEGRRFVARFGHDEAYLVYHPLDDATVDYVSTFVPPHLRRRGIGEAIVRRALAWAREQGYRVVPSCWFVRQIMGRDAG
jgi:predicted GNAT family acetyltransferase